MVATILVVVAGAGWALYRVVGDTGHSIPRSNDDMVFI